MSCLAQIPVRGHLDHVEPLAGRPDLLDKVLHVFTCERLTICDFWDPHRGANAAFFLDEEELRRGEQWGGPIVSVLPEVWIEGWASHDDLVAEEAVDSFTDDTSFYALPEKWQFPHDFDTTLRTKLGGVPYWTGNGPSNPPRPPFRFLLQVDKWLTLPEVAEGAVELGNFCSDGTGFVFVNLDTAELPALFVINR
ncbi:hypothetical protein C8J45_1185 [Sphingomonas sp. PP-CE-3G-477]|uniref:hypothetical protein n=1 Tax=Sphingomonas sp. PP-CE-3G-477 TaxID=2135660 RepID=UPI000D37A460|nr:hypothetical protein [Sphingomonas sp. PP-CE-3G-477]PTQ58802.1 hypothetical protein C8J45_1185 [Sphingomonas sp. PP-CE-3G-477]